MRIEIDLAKLDRGTHVEQVRVTRGGKTFYRKQRVGRKEVDKPESFKDIKNYHNNSEFVRGNIKELKELGIKDMEGSEKLYNRIRMERFDVKELSKDDSFAAIRASIPVRIHEGWFRNADRSYKIHIFNALLNNDDARSGTLKIMHDTYKIQNDSDISFDDFINTEISIYRGGDVTDDVFTSFTMVKSIAEKFMVEYKIDKMTEIKVKPIQILGMCQSTGESEVLVPKDLLEGILNKAEKTKSTLTFDEYLASLRYPNGTN